MRLFKLINLLALCCTVYGCQNEPYPTSNKDISKYIDSHFAFHSTFDCPVNISVDTKAYVEVFDKSPMSNADITPVYTIFTDERGCYNGTMHLPTALIGKTLYAKVGNRMIDGVVRETGIAFTTKSSRALEDSFDWEVLKSELMAQLPSETYNAEKLERSDNVNIITVEDGTVIDFYYITCSNFLTKINYYYYKNDTDIKEKFLSPKALSDCFNDDRFCISKGWGTSDKYSQDGYENDGNYISQLGDKGNAPTTGTSYRLKFYGENYDKTGSEEFPAGYSIGLIFHTYNFTSHVNTYLFSNSVANPNGFCDGMSSEYAHSEGNLLPNNWVTSWENISAFKFDNGVKSSTKELNIAGPYKQLGRFYKEVIDDNGNRLTGLVYGLEDMPIWWDTPVGEGVYDVCDLDYNDMIFLITATSADIRDIPVLVGGQQTLTGTLMFEDLYPSQGDYDMNDVILEYKYVVKFDDDNKVTSIDYEYTPLWNGATYVNDFYLGVYDGSPSSYSNYKIISDFGNMAKTSGNMAKIESDPNANDLANVFGTINQGGIIGMDKDEVLTLSNHYLNPYIIPRDTGYEIHLAKYPYCGEGKMCADNLYLLNYLPDGKSGECPFAMDIPLHRKSPIESLHKGFIPVSESNYIYLEYAEYAGWTSSNGEDYRDWYLPEKWRNLYK